MNALQDFYLKSLRVQGYDAGWKYLYKLRFSEVNIFSFDIAFVSAVFVNAPVTKLPRFWVVCPNCIFSPAA